MGLYPFKELLELVCGAEEASKLYSATITQLENGTWRTGASTGGSRGAIKKEFEMPREPRGAASTIMNAIGRALIGSRKNYEEVLMEELGSDASLGNPAITE